MADIKEVNFHSVTDIPGMMERMAGDIREGKVNPRFGVAVFIDGDEEITVCGWGADPDGLSAIGLLGLGAAWLSVNKVRR